MRLVILLLLIVAVAFIMRIPAERFELESKLKKKTVASPDDIQKMVAMTQDALNKKLDACTHCIEVSTVDLVGDSMYHANFVFVVTKTFPYGISVRTTIKKDAKGPTNIVTLELQSTETIDQVEKYDEFVRGSEIQDKSVPSRTELQSLVKNL